VSKSMLVKRSRFVDTLRDAASFCRLTSFIKYLIAYIILSRKHKFKLAFEMARSFIVNKVRATNWSISPDE